MIVLFKHLCIHLMHPTVAAQTKAAPFRGFIDITLKCMLGLFGRGIKPVTATTRKESASIHETSGIRTHDRVSTP
jgi:hypothetical protein